MGKEEILSKLNIKDYSKDLEDVMEQKDFGEEAKNLLLDILYKIDTTYADYNKVKIETFSKKEIVEELIEIIKNDCKQIEIIKPNLENQNTIKEYKINKNIISVFPNANILMFALYEVCHKKFKVSKIYEIISKPIEKMLNNGWQNSKCEIIRDFDGWNWNIEKDLINNLTYNLIYQNLDILLGNNFLEKNIDTRKDILKIIENKLKLQYDEEIAKQIMLLMYKICLLEELVCDNKKLDMMIKTKEVMQEELKNMENKKQYLQNLAESKKTIGKRIRKIDEILCDNKVLKTEFIKVNKEVPEENKIFSISDYVDILQNERNNLMKQLELYSDLMKPANYIKSKTNLKERIDILKDLKQKDFNIKENLKLKIIEFQKLFLKVLNKKIAKISTKKELIDLVYEIRYFKLLPIENVQIKDIKEFEKDIQKTETLLITKGCKLKVLPIISSTVSENYKIMSKILESKIIDLEKISISLKTKQDKILISIYDDNVIDSVIECEKIEDLNVKLNKKIKIFI